MELSERGDSDAILIDVQMPGMGEPEATKQMRRREAETLSERTPIIAFTAGTTTKERREAEEAGMDDRITKPIDSQRLVEGLDQWVGQGRK